MWTATVALWTPPEVIKNPSKGFKGLVALSLLLLFFFFSDFARQTITTRTFKSNCIYRNSYCACPGKSASSEKIWKTLGLHFRLFSAYDNQQNKMKKKKKAKEKKQKQIANSREGDKFYFQSYHITRIKWPIFNKKLSQGIQKNWGKCGSLKGKGKWKLSLREIRR